MDELSSFEPVYTVLDLSGFDLYRNKTPAEIVKILETIPANIISINLSPNRLGNIIPAELIKIAQAIPLTVKKVNLAFNRLFNLNSSDIISLIRNINARIEVLDLSGNDLGSKDTTDIICILKATPSSTTTLKLQNNNLSEYNMDILLEGIVFIINKCTRIRSIVGIEHMNKSQLVPLYTAEDSLIVTMYHSIAEHAAINRRILLNWWASLVKFLSDLPYVVADLILNYLLLPTLDRQIIKDLQKQENCISFVNVEEYKKTEPQTNKQVIRYLPAEFLWQSSKSALLSASTKSTQQTKLENKTMEQPEATAATNRMIS